MFIAYGIDLVALSISLRDLDMGVVYAIWTGLSTTFLALVSFFLFNEPAKLLKIISIGLIIVGTIMLKAMG